MTGEPYFSVDYSNGVLTLHGGGARLARFNDEYAGLLMRMVEACPDRAAVELVLHAVYFGMMAQASAFGGALCAEEPA